MSDSREIREDFLKILKLSSCCNLEDRDNASQILMYAKANGLMKSPAGRLFTDRLNAIISGEDVSGATCIICNQRTAEGGVICASCKHIYENSTEAGKEDLVNAPIVENAEAEQDNSQPGEENKHKKEATLKIGKKAKEKDPKPGKEKKAGKTKEKQEETGELSEQPDKKKNQTVITAVFIAVAAVVIIALIIGIVKFLQSSKKNSTIGVEEGLVYDSGALSGKSGAIAESESEYCVRLESCLEGLFSYADYISENSELSVEAYSASVYVVKLKNSTIGAIKFTSDSRGGLQAADLTVDVPDTFTDDEKNVIAVLLYSGLANSASQDGTEKDIETIIENTVDGQVFMDGGLAYVRNGLKELEVINEAYYLENING